jgi:hypothetical protein
MEPPRSGARKPSGDERNADAAAFSRGGDPDNRDFEDAVILRPSGKCRMICLARHDPAQGRTDGEQDCS